MASYETNRRWADTFLPHALKIINERTVRVSTGEEDLERNTDLIVFACDETRYAFRVRRLEYHDRYGGEFTIRVRSRHTAASELQKIRDGWGDFLLYGFGDDEGVLRHWFLGDLAVLREHLRLTPKPRAIENGDGTAFAPFRLRDLPRWFVRDASWLAQPDDNQLEFVGGMGRR